jgi:hypothetical protein
VTHLLVVHTVGVDRSESGVAAEWKLQAAVHDTAVPGSAPAMDVPATVTIALPPRRAIVAARDSLGQGIAAREGMAT